MWLLRSYSADKDYGASSTAPSWEATVNEVKFELYDGMKWSRLPACEILFLAKFLAAGDLD